MNDIEEYLIDRIGEKYIVNEILEMKKRMEFMDICDTIIGDGDWNRISTLNLSLDLDFVRKYRDRLNWRIISFNRTLSIEFVREFQDNIDWGDLSWNCNITIEIIREFQDNIDWVNISMNHGLTIEMAREFQDNIDWRYVALNKTLSYKFVREFQDILNIGKCKWILNRVTSSKERRKKQGHLWRLNKWAPW